MTNTILQRFSVKFDQDRVTGCHVWRGAICQATGYGRFSVRRINCRAHRVCWELFMGPIPDGMWVLHKCDNRACVNPAHLFLGTRLDNVRDMISKGRNNPPRGATHPKAKLRESDVLSIRQSPLTSAALARQYGVTHKAIAFIRERVNWKHI